MAIDRRQNWGYLPLRDAIDRLFAGSYISPDIFGQEGLPAADVYTTDDDVMICLAVPGANPDDIDVSVTGDMVTISGEISHRHELGQPPAQGQQQRRQGPQSYMQEIWSGRFSRSFTLPTQVDPNAAEATFEHGILSLKLPKAEAVKPRRIKVGQTLEGKSAIEKETIPVQSK